MATESTSYRRVVIARVCQDIPLEFPTGVFEIIVVGEMASRNTWSLASAILTLELMRRIGGGDNRGITARPSITHQINTG